MVDRDLRNEDRKMAGSGSDKTAMKDPVRKAQLKQQRVINL
jgi:hypothetical protein